MGEISELFNNLFPMKQEVLIKMSTVDVLSVFLLLISVLKFVIYFSPGWKRCSGG